MTDFFAIAAMAGIAALTCFSIAVQGTPTSRFLTVCRNVSAAAAVADLWCLALFYRWTTVALFLAISLATGLCCFFWQRRFGNGTQAPIATVAGVLLLLTGIASAGYVATATPTPDWFVWCPVC